MINILNRINCSNALGNARCVLIEGRRPWAWWWIDWDIRMMRDDWMTLGLRWDLNCIDITFNTLKIDWDIRMMAGSNVVLTVWRTYLQEDIFVIYLNMKAEYMVKAITYLQSKCVNLLFNPRLLSLAIGHKCAALH